VIGKQSGRLVETTQLWRNDDGPETVTRYSDITPNAELSNELFLPPDEVTFKTVNSIEEYSKLETEATVESLKGFRPAEKGLPVKHPLDVGPPVFDEATGAYTFSPPPGFTAEEWDVELTRVVLEDMQREGNRLPGEPALNERIKALAISRLSPAQLADLAYFEKPKSIAKEESARAAPRDAEPAASGLMRALFNYGNLPLLIVNVGAIGTLAWILIGRWRDAGRGRS
jgi:hypothetical protein